MFTDKLITNILTLVVTLSIIFVVWIKWAHGYWSRRGVLVATPTFFFGSAKGVFTQKQSFSDFTKELYNYFKENRKVHGGFYMLHMATYMPIDPDIIKNILQTNFDHFVDRGIYYNEHIDPLSAHLFSLEGAKWRNLRVKLTPTFTSGKMKMMFDVLVKCGDQLIVEMDKIADKEPFETKNISERFTTDIIGNCAFGIDCSTLKNPDNEYCKNLKLFFVDSFWSNILGFVTFVAPDLARKLSMKATNTDLEKFFMRLITDTVKYREKNNVYRKDFMHLLLQLKNRGKLVDDGNILGKDVDDDNKDSQITFNELAAQAFVFFLAGFETSSTTMTFCLYEMASNPDIQEKLRKEICTVLEKHNNELTYDAIMEMAYLEMVINETLRKYPPLPALNRVCTKECQVPGTDIVLEKGTKIWIPVVGLHHDPDYFPNPQAFDPERFSSKKTRHAYTYLPFGEGPRNCIGLRFGLMQTKVGVVALLKNYKFSVNSKTMVPLQFDPKSFVSGVKGGVWLDCTKV